MRLAFFAKGVGVCVEAAKSAHDVRLAHTKPSAKTRSDRCSVRRLLWAVTAVTPAVVSRANRAAARVRYRTETGRSMCDHHANGPAQLALDADAVRRCVRPAVMQEGANDFYELTLIDWATAQLEINEDMISDRRGFVQRLEIGRRGVDDAREFLHIFEVAERLDAAARGAGANSHQIF